jgi:hypothetical protein
MEPALTLGYIVFLDERGYRLFQFKQQLDGLSSPFDNWGTFGLVSTFRGNGRPDELLRARLLLPPSPRTTLLGVDRRTCSIGILVQYGDQSREAVYRDLPFRPILHVVHDDLKGGLRCLLVGDSTPEN